MESSALPSGRHCPSPATHQLSPKAPDTVKVFQPTLEALIAETASLRTLDLNSELHSELNSEPSKMNRRKNFLAAIRSVGLEGFRGTI